MNPYGRGRTTADIHLIRTAVREDNTTIAITSDGEPGGRRLDFPDSPLGRQLCSALWAQIPLASQGGRWASAPTVRRGHGYLLSLHEDWSDGDLTFATPAVAIGDFSPLIKRTKGAFRGLRRSLAWALREYHPNGDVLADRLLAIQLDSTIRRPTQAYSDDEAAGIEKAARDRFRADYLAHRDLLASVGVDVSDRNWILLDAGQVTKIARDSGSTEAQALLAAALDADDPRLFPSADTLAAAAVAMCLAENLGPNLSMLQSLTVDSVNAAGAVDMTKARARSSFRVPSSTAEFTSFAGLATALVGMTRFARKRRDDRANGNPVLERNSRLLFVPGRRDNALDSVSATEWAKALAETVGVSTISMRRLRETAEFRGKRATGTGTVVGHGREQSLRYLADGMPDELMYDLLIEAQDDIVRFCELAVQRKPLERFSDVAADHDAEEITDRGVAVCDSGAIDPATDDLCNRGILGCFVCPSAHITDANLAGLKAAVTFTDHMRAHDPDEWTNGPAGTLNQLCHTALEQFPAMEVRATDERPLLPVIAAMYIEVRA